MEKPSPLLLALSLLIAGLYWLAPVIWGDYAREREKLRLKKLFNRRLQDGTLNQNQLASLKILINNYDSVQDKGIFAEEDEWVLAKAVEDLIIVHPDRWYLWTLQFHLAIVGPILLPIAIYCVKALINGLRKTALFSSNTHPKNE